jgi:nickel transport protein
MQQNRIIGVKKKNCMRGIFIIIIFSMLLPLTLTDSANAHRITVFAWVEGDTVHVESKFSGGKRVQGGEVIVYDLEDNQLLTGKTDEQGEFSFTVPQQTGLKVEVIAGMGHRGDWTIPAEEMGEASAESAETSAAPQIEPQKPVAEEKTVQSVAAPGLGAEDIQMIVEKSLDKKLKPMMNILVDSQEKGPSMTDIFGGIGYIFGLVGVAAYFSSRRKKTGEN